MIAPVYVLWAAAAIMLMLLILGGVSGAWKHVLIVATAVIAGILAFVYGDPPAPYPRPSMALPIFLIVSVLTAAGLWWLL